MTIFYPLPHRWQLNSFEYFVTNQSGKLYFVFLLALIILFIGILIAVIRKSSDKHPKRTAKHAMWIGLIYMLLIIPFEFADKGQTYFAKALDKTAYADGSNTTITNIASPLGNRLDQKGVISWNNKLQHKTKPLATVQYQNDKLKLQSLNKLGTAFLKVASYAQKQPIDFDKARQTRDSLELNVYGNVVEANYYLNGYYWTISANSRYPQKLKIVKNRAM